MLAEHSRSLALSEEVPSVMLSFCVMGYKASGKTSVTKRFIFNSFTENDVASASVSVEAAFHSRILLMKESVAVHFLVWDCPGSSKCTDLLPVFYCSSQVAMLCFRDNAASCAYVKKLASDILNQVHSNNIRCIAFILTKSSDCKTANCASVKAFANAKGLLYYQVDCLVEDNSVRKMFREIGLSLVEGHPHLTPPEWTPDADASNCSLCQRAFSTFRRRHHCRNCGQIFCSSCSSRFVEIARLDTDKAVRVCDNCHAVVTRL